VVVKEDYSGAQAATVESKPGKKKLKKMKKEEREKTKGLSVTRLAFSHLFWIRIRIDLAHWIRSSSQFGSRSRFRSNNFCKNGYGLHWS
jgi:hypothetical protein